MILALQIALVILLSGLVVFAADYTRLTRGAVWKDPIGLTIILKDVLLAGSLVPVLLAAFFRLSTLGNQIATWVLIVFWAAGGLVMYWRTLVFERIHRRGKKDGLIHKTGSPPSFPGAGGFLTSASGEIPGRQP